jgi:GT2 family glycosyltransferase
LLTPLFREHAARVGSTAPRFSIITPMFDTKPQWLAEAAVSLLQQSREDWEWCITDDGSRSGETTQMLQALAEISPRVRIQFAANAGISAATNAALDRATGEFVCFLDHDDSLEADALQEFERKLRAGFDVVYSDEDKLAEPSGERVEPFFKPDWSPEYFRGAMYLGHLLCVRRELALRTRFDSAFDSVQDFEFMLRVSEGGARIGHIAKVLYHWRKTPGSIAQAMDAKPEIERLQERAVNAQLQRLGLPARAETKRPHRLRMVPLPRENNPRVTIIIPSRDAPEHLGRCLRSIFAMTSYPDFEVIVMDNDTVDPEALRILAEHPVRRIPFPGVFNFSQANNRGVAAAQGELVVFLNNDTEIITADWLQQLRYYAEQQDVGAAGALLVYDDRTVQHAGVALGMRGTADHLMRNFPLDVDGYAGSLACAREVSAVTAACMMIRKSLFDEIGGFNEHFLTAYQDLDLCLRLRARDLRVIHTPEAVVVHHEWTSRKTYYDMVDRMLLLDQWEHVIEAGDPYYNRNLNLERGDYSIAYRW